VCVCVGKEGEREGGRKEGREFSAAVGIVAAFSWVSTRGGCCYEYK